MPSTRNIIIFLVIATIFLSVYLFFKKDAPAPTTAIVSATPGSALVSTVLPTTGNEGVAKEFLDLLLSVKSIKLDDSIFSQNAFRSLHDSSITLIQDGTEGRPNPFAPIGTDVSIPDTNNRDAVTTTPDTNTNTNSSTNNTTTNPAKPTNPSNPTKPASGPQKPPTSSNN